MYLFRPLSKPPALSITLHNGGRGVREKEDSRRTNYFLFCPCSLPASAPHKTSVQPMTSCPLWNVALNTVLLQYKEGSNQLQGPLFYNSMLCNCIKSEDMISHGNQQHSHTVFCSSYRFPWDIEAPLILTGDVFTRINTKRIVNYFEDEK